MNRDITRGVITSFGLTPGMGSLLSAPVLPASRQSRTEQSATSAASRQAESRSLVKRSRSATSSRSTTPAVMAADSRNVCQRKDRRAGRHVPIPSWGVTLLSLGRFAGELRIQGVVEQLTPFQGDLVIGTD